MITQKVHKLSEMLTFLNIKEYVLFVTNEEIATDYFFQSPYMLSFNFLTDKSPYEELVTSYLINGIDFKIVNIDVCRKQMAETNA